MRILKENVLLRFVNSYVVNSPQPANLTYLWNFDSLLATCLIIQILTGAFLAMYMHLLIIEMPINLITMIENISCKPTNLPKIKMRRGLEHVSKVLIVGSYKYPRNKVILIYVSTIHLSQDAKLIPKIAVMEV